jgi:hypothetical protein
VVANREHVHSDDRSVGIAAGIHDRAVARVGIPAIGRGVEPRIRLHDIRERTAFDTAVVARRCDRSALPAAAGRDRKHERKYPGPRPSDGPTARRERHSSSRVSHASGPSLFQFRRERPLLDGAVNGV